MSRKSAAVAAVLASIALTNAADAFDLEYVSHLGMHRPDVGLTEPSGLAVDPDASGWWIVSDEARTVFRLDADGEISHYIDFDDRLRDLEGLAVDEGNSRLLVVSERTGSIFAIPLEPPHRIEAIDLAALSAPTDLSEDLKDRDDGLEGVGVDPDTGNIYVLKERKPRLLIEIAPSLERVISVRNLDDVLPEDEDVSGLALDPERRGFWIVSDVGRAVHFLPHFEGKIATFDLVWHDGNRKHRLHNPEGVALSPDGQSLFVISDDGEDSRLVQYEIVSR